MEIMNRFFFEFKKYYISLKSAFLRNLSKENILEVLQEYTPFVNKLWIPIFNVSTNPASRSKFSPIDDNLLLIGIKKYGPKYFSLHFIG